MQTRRSLLFLTVLLVTGFLTAACENKSGTATAQTDSTRTPAVQVSVITVAPETVRDVIFLPGTTEAWQDVQVAADIAGRIEWIGPREGERVRKGDLLIKIDVSALKAALEHAEAQFQLADDLYQRRRRLYERKIIAREELDQSATQRKLAATDLEDAQHLHADGSPQEHLPRRRRHPLALPRRLLRPPHRRHRQYRSY